jgi:Asp-tRNA(Asn)/Glu-tRNA(Gln) amidotransferase A subunit family amidase
MDRVRLHAGSASDVARLIRAGAVSAREYVDACHAHIDEVDAHVHAWTFIDREYALEQARAADESRLRGHPMGPLHGVPVGLKDIIDTRDMPTENGSVLHAGRTPSHDAAVVSMLRAAGAIIMGKTVTTEFATRTPGKTRNPHNPAHTPGGSSSGSAAAVGAAMVPLALGSQTTGSTIRPASYCGVYGFKPTHGLVPRHGMFQLSRTLDHVGLFARTIDDIALLLEPIVGHDERDPDTRPRPRVPYGTIAAEAPPITPLLAWVATPRWDAMDADARAAFDNLLTRLHGRIEEVKLPGDSDEALRCHETISGAEIAMNLHHEWETGRNGLSPALRARIEKGRAVPGFEYLRALRRLPAIAAGFSELLEQRYDAILTPASYGTAPAGLDNTGDPVFCAPWTLCGMPALSMPLMRGANGLPLGAQLVGPRHGDARLLRTARWLVSELSPDA